MGIRLEIKEIMKIIPHGNVFVKARLSEMLSSQLSKVEQTIKVNFHNHNVE